MTFEEWFKSTSYTDRDCAEEAWEAGIQEGINRMYLLHGAWEAGFEEGYKFANKENEEYDKIGC